MEKIGYINKKELNLISGKNSLESILTEIKFDEREIVEQFNHVVQPICAGTIITKTGKVLIVNKATKSTGKVSPEKNKTLLYVGGHLDSEDYTGCVYEALVHGMRREILEELGYKVKMEEIGKPIVVYTTITEKSAKHMGIIFQIIIEKEFDTNFTDGKCRFVKIEELNDIKNFESWSEIIFKEMISTYDKEKENFN